MPELPEVEVTRRQVAKVLRGASIESVWTSRPSYFFVTPPAELQKRLVGQKVRSLNRRGKYLLLQLADNSTLLLHLGMTGQLLARDTQESHVHLRLFLSNQHIIAFRDVRKFGKVEWIAPQARSRRLEKLGPDALTIEASELALGLGRRKIAVKQALLDQAVLAGVGNIYADEALFRARILPTRPSESLSQPEVKRLLGQIKKVLESSILHGGSTINDYLKPNGEFGGYQDWHQVYGRTGEPCPRCHTPLSRIVLGGRSSHYCSHCQT